MLKIPVESIPTEGHFIDDAFDVQSFSDLNEIAGECDAVFHGPVHIRLELKRRQETVAVAGTVASDVRMTCCRCLDRFDVSVEGDVSILFTSDTPESGESGEIVELNEKLARMERLKGDTIDLEKCIREHLIMALPVQPICRTECKGLCHSCGKNLNRHDCSCAPADDFGPFAALKKLKIPESR